MRARGYQLSEEEEKFLRGEEAELTYNATYTKTKRGILYETEVYYLYDEKDKNAIDGWPKSGKDDIRKILSVYKNPPETFTLILVGNDPTSSALTHLANNRTMVDYYIEFWTLEQLIVSPLMNFTVPKHTIMTEEEIRRELPSARQEDAKKAKAFVSTMKGLINDVVARWIGARDGDIVKIVRHSNILSGELPDYRIVRKSVFDK
jgi:DNA-directed RNA polymerase subunit H (RpoH/RPB5)